MDKLKSFLINKHIEFYENFDIASVSSIKLGEGVRLAIFPKNIKQLENVVKYFFARKIYFRVFGNTSNVLFYKFINFPVVITSKMLSEIKVNGCEVEASAGVLLSKLSDVLRKNELSGFEGLANIPASVGGAIKNGAGAFGYNIYDRLVSISALVNGKNVEILKNQINFKHHYSNLSGVFILSAKFLFEKRNEYDIMKKLNEFAYLRAKSQPVGFSLGSVYQKIGNNSAGFFIERSGLKGVKVGGLEVSNKHANFFVNDGTGTAIDFLRLSTLVESSVVAHFGVNLLPEIEKVGDIDEINSRLSHSFKQLKI